MPRAPQTSTRKATGVACANIALIKYWGNRDDALRLPANGSISFNLDGLSTQTGVEWQDTSRQDSLSINAKPVTGDRLRRVSSFLDLIRSAAGMDSGARIESQNNFPDGAGLASSAAGFAALALAASTAAGLELDEAHLSRLARRGSGSACRSIAAGFVEWRVGTGDEDSHAISIAPPGHWALADVIAVVSTAHKATGSTEGHALAPSSPLQAARVTDAPRRLDLCRQAILERDFDKLAAITELDSNLMHAVMQTCTPPLFYWIPATVRLMQMAQQWRNTGMPVCYTIDAGPNVHFICTEEVSGDLAGQVAQIPELEKVLVARVGDAAHLI